MSDFDWNYERHQKPFAKSRMVAAFLVGLGLALPALIDMPKSVETGPAVISGMVRTPSGKTEYFPPEYRHERRAAPQDGWSPIDDWKKPVTKLGPESYGYDERALDQLIRKIDH